MSSVELASDFYAIADEWDDLAEVDDVPVFQTYEWLRTWWKHFGRNTEPHKLHIFLFYQEDRLVGIAPFFTDHFWFMGKKIYRRLRLIGSKVMQAICITE
ncbi:MAG TPA: hypothetical protein VKA08_12800 [Balneolales bacterium]|nr:hypothetical protein [Balneolales bacterium]